MAITYSTSSAHPVRSVLAARILEDAALTAEMLGLAPPGSEDWRPPGWPATQGDPPFSMGRLEAHLVESMGGICACLYKLHPEEMAGFAWLKDGAAAMPARDAMADLQAAARAGFELVTDADLMRNLPTVFAPEGEPALAVLLVNWKHLLHHAHQLFVYLKVLGVAVDTQRLYRF